MRLRLRVTEDGSGRWLCSTVSQRLDSHDQMIDAIIHLQAKAESLPCCELWLEFADGTRTQLAATAPALAGRALADRTLAR